MSDYNNHYPPISLYVILITMAKFLDGAQVHATLTEIIKEAESELFIIAPYLKIPQQTQNYLKNADKKNIQFKIISRSDAEIQPDNLKFLSELVHADVKLCENLHAKCFLNEKTGLITSMNLHEHSQTHNWEMGIRFSNDEDRVLFADVQKEVKMIDEASKQNPNIKQISTQSVARQNYSHQTPQKTVYKPKEAPNKGLFTKVIDSVLGEEAYCIRCGHSMGKYNLEKPLCDGCYSKWAQFKKKDYPENVCHACGQQKSNISYNKPTCRDCYNRLYKKS